MAKSKAKTDNDRYTRQQMAAMFCVRPEHFDKTYRQHVPDKYIETVGRRVFFKPEAVRSVLDGSLQAEQDKMAAADGDTMLAGGGDSAGLERYRMAKAQTAELDLELRRGESIKVTDVEQLIGIVSARIRSLGARAVKRFGKDAGKMIDKALDDAQQEIEARFGSTD